MESFIKYVWHWGGRFYVCFKGKGFIACGHSKYFKRHESMYFSKVVQMPGEDVCRVVCNVESLTYFELYIPYNRVCICLKNYCFVDSLSSRIWLSVLFKMFWCYVKNVQEELGYCGTPRERLKNADFRVWHAFWTAPMIECRSLLIMNQRDII